VAAYPQQAARVQALSIQLARIHAGLRSQLADARASLDQPERGARVALEHHCLAFCQALSTHHRGEDTGLFTELVRQRPDLQPVVDKLVEDHQFISGLIVGVEALLTEAKTVETPEHRAALGRNLDGLAAIMASHFAYEERAISDALDHDVVDTSWTTTVFELSP
jgi:hypothetical protein